MDDTSAYKDIFLQEARSGLEAMTAALLEAEKAAEKSEPLTALFRNAHTLKAMAGMMRLGSTASLCHALEDALEPMRRRQSLSTRDVNMLLEGLDGLERALRAFESGEPEPDLGELTRALRGLAAAHPPAQAPTPPAPEPAPGSVKSKHLPVKIERLDLLMNLVEELLVVKLRFDQLQAALRSPELTAAVDGLDRLVSELQYQVTQARMVPISLIFNRFPRLVRDLSQQQHKEIALSLEGGGLEVDRVVTEEISDSMIHLLRNAVDHGIETPQERRRRGKPASGAIRVAATRTKDRAVIEVEDDGAGLDLEEIRRAGVSRGAVAPNASNEDLMRAVVSGLSTSKTTTAVSGRGLGLSIVEGKMRSLGGALSVSSRAGHGTVFRLEVPLTMAILKALLVRAGRRTYALPLAGIERIVSVDASQVRKVLRGQAFVIGDRDVPLLRLRAVLGLKEDGAERFPVVMLRHGPGQAVGLAVDSLTAGTQEIVLKPLSRVLREARPFAGSAIIGTGEAILVLDAAELVRRGSLGALA